MQRFLPVLFLLATVGPSGAQSITWLSACTDQVFCTNPGSCTEGSVLLTEKAYTTCSGGYLNYSYKIDLNNNGNTDIQVSNDSVSGIFPLGTHRITWRVNDNCGNVSTACSYLFTIKDCAPPNLLCLNGLTQNLKSPECQATYNAESFIISVNDNCTPTKDIQVAMREAGTGTGFPTGKTLTFGICDQGLHILEIWVKDKNNLVNQCNSYVLVQDNAGVCICDKDADLELKGCAQLAGGKKLSEYTVRATLEGTDLQGKPVTKAVQKNVPDSCFSALFGALPLNGNYQGVLQAFRTGDPLNGVSTFDLVLINKHILGQQPLQNFYQTFAADVNKSQTITTFDIVEIRKLILGINDTFPAVPAWRLIRPVPDPLNLVAFGAVKDTFRFSTVNLDKDLSLGGYNFIGVKMGDVNSNAALTGGAEPRSGAPLLFRMENPRLAAGAAAWVPIYCTENIRLDGWQLALRANTDLLEIADVRGVPAEYVALLPNGECRISWVGGDTPLAAGPAEPICSVRVKARTAVHLSDALALDAGALAAEAYPAAGEDADIRPLLLQTGQATGDVVFFPPQPNPFTSATAFPVLLTRDEVITLELYDLSGRLVYETTSARDAGYHLLHLPATMAPGPGVWAYRLRAGGAVASGRVVRL